MSLKHVGVEDAVDYGMLLAYLDYARHATGVDVVFVKRHSQRR